MDNTILKMKRVASIIYGELNVSLTTSRKTFILLISAQYHIFTSPQSQFALNKIKPNLYCRCGS